MELFEAFGIDWRLIVIQLINFAILVGLLSYLLYKPVLKIVREREDAIKKGVLAAEAAATEREAAREERKHLLETTERDVRAMKMLADEEAMRSRETILENAKEQGERILKEAHARADAESEEVRRKSESDIARLAMLASAKILKKNT